VSLTGSSLIPNILYVLFIAALFDSGSVHAAWILTKGEKES